MFSSEFHLFLLLFNHSCRSRRLRHLLFLSFFSYLRSQLLSLSPYFYFSHFLLIYKCVCVCVSLSLSLYSNFLFFYIFTLFSCSLLVEYGGVAARLAPIHLALSGMQALEFALLEGFRFHGNRQRHVHPDRHENEKKGEGDVYK